MITSPKRKRRIVIFFALISFLSPLFAGCANRPPAYRIVVIPKGMSHEHWQSIHRGALRAAADLTAEGIPTEIIWDGPLRERDSLAQIRIVDRWISTHVDGILIAPQHSETTVAPVRRAVEQHIPIIILDSGLNDTDAYIKYVATDNFNGGYLAAKHLIHLLRAIDHKPNPRLILFRCAVGSEATEQREAGFEKYIAEEEAAGRIKVHWLSNDKYGGVTKDSALKEAAPLVNKFAGQIDGIFAPNESTADGMLDALRSLGLAGKVRLMGFDCSEPLLQAVGDGEVDGLVLQDPYRMGYVATWIMVQHLRGYDVAPDSKVLSTGEHVITKENLDALSTRELFDPSLQAVRNFALPVLPRRK